MQRAAGYGRKEWARRHGQLQEQRAREHVLSCDRSFLHEYAHSHSCMPTEDKPAVARFRKECGCDAPCFRCAAGIFPWTKTNTNSPFRFVVNMRQIWLLRPSPECARGFPTACGKRLLWNDNVPRGCVRTGALDCFGAFFPSKPPACPWILSQLDWGASHNSQRKLPG